MLVQCIVSWIYPTNSKLSFVRDIEYLFEVDKGMIIYYNKDDDSYYQITVDILKSYFKQANF